MAGHTPGPDLEPPTKDNSQERLFAVKTEAAGRPVLARWKGDGHLHRGLAFPTQCVTESELSKLGTGWKKENYRSTLTEVVEFHHPEEVRRVTQFCDEGDILDTTVATNALQILSTQYSEGKEMKIVPMSMVLVRTPNKESYIARVLRVLPSAGIPSMSRHELIYLIQFMDPEYKYPGKDNSRLACLDEMLYMYPDQACRLLSEGRSCYPDLRFAAYPSTEKHSPRKSASSSQCDNEARQSPEPGAGSVGAGKTTEGGIPNEEPEAPHKTSAGKRRISTLASPRRAEKESNGLHVASEKRRKTASGKPITVPQQSQTKAALMAAASVEGTDGSQSLKAQPTVTGGTEFSPKTGNAAPPGTSILTEGPDERFVPDMAFLKDCAFISTREEKILKSQITTLERSSRSPKDFEKTWPQKSEQAEKKLKTSKEIYHRILSDGEAVYRAELATRKRRDGKDATRDLSPSTEGSMDTNKEKEKFDKVTGAFRKYLNDTIAYHCKSFGKKYEDEAVKD